MNKQFLRANLLSFLMIAAQLVHFAENSRVIHIPAVVAVLQHIFQDFTLPCLRFLHFTVFITLGIVLVHLWILFSCDVWGMDAHWVVHCMCWQVTSPFPPSDKIGIKSVQREEELIVPMKEMKMDWVPFIPPDVREWVLSHTLLCASWFRRVFATFGCARWPSEYKNTLASILNVQHFSKYQLGPGFHISLLSSEWLGTFADIALVLQV
jgi:hypothetical protein